MLYIPINATPPYEAIVYWSGSDALWYQSIDEEYLDAFGFLMKSGRVVARPIFWGTFDRDDADSPITPESLWNGSRSTKSIWYRDLRVTWLQELSRSIDLLEERDEIDTERVGFYGFSWGGSLAPIALAVESQRIAVALLNVGGLDADNSFLPEVDAINFVTRVSTPVLMINGEFDVVVPLETHQKPLYKLLGTDPEHKKWIVVPAAHLVPEDLLIREGLDWFDRYMGGAE